MMKLALVTGATGFVGANLVAALTQTGWRVRVLHRSSSRLHALDGLTFEPALGDVLDRDSVQRALEGCQVVYHAAGVADYWRSSRERMFQVNVEGTRHVMAAALAGGVPRVVHTSSAAALGIPPLGRPATEAQTWNVSPNRFPYGHSKHLAELVVQEYVAQGLPAVIVNPTVILGPRDVNLGSDSLIVGVYKRQLPFVLPGGVNVIGVADVAAGHLLAAARGRVGERYLLGGQNVSVPAFARLIGEVIGVPAPTLVLPRVSVAPLAALTGLASRVSPWPLPVTADLIRLGAEPFYFDPSKAIRELGLPQTPLRQVVQEAFDWLVIQGYLH